MAYARSLAAGQRCRVRVANVASGDVRTVHESHAVLLEAPNWTADDRLILNGDGLLWSMPADGSVEPRTVAIAGVPELNNDHVLAPDGETIYLSANDWHIYAAPLAGGAARRVTADGGARMHFLHGVSPDGSTLAYVGLTPADGDWWAAATVRTVRTDGTGDSAVTDGTGPDDGPEYSPDGAWIYFNTERFSRNPGHAQIARISVGGGEPEQLTFDDRVNWFPHLSPDGARAVYLSYPPGTEGHPADRPVQLMLVEDDGWAQASIFVELFGGQGTINVNSWAPDGTRFAYVDYPIAGTAP